MNTNMQGHKHGGKSHLLWMLGLGGVIFVVLLGTGRSVGQALPLALFLACPLMMVGMMFMMGGDKGHQHGNDAADHQHRDDAADHQHRDDPTDHQPGTDATDHQDRDAPATWQDSPNITRAPKPPRTTSWS